MIRTYDENNNSSVIDGITVSDNNSINVAVEPTYVVPGARAPRSVVRRIQNREIELQEVREQ